MTSEILIIGGGVIGLSIARELHRRGLRRITIVERGKIGHEASFAAAGMLAPQAETDETDDFYRLCAKSNVLYTDFAAELLQESGIDIELERTGTLYLAMTEHDSAELKKRFEWQKSAGLSVEHFNAAETLAAEPLVSPRVRDSLFFPNDWQVENRKLLAALRKYAEINGIAIHEGIAIDEVFMEGGKAVGAFAGREEFRADRTIAATGAWTSLIKLGESPIPVKVKPIRGQMISFQAPKPMFQHVIYTPRGYLVPRADGRILIGATVEDVGFDKGVTESGVSHLRVVASEIAPCLGEMSVTDRWAGLRPMAQGGLPVIGPVAECENLIVATGHYRNGILLAPVTAKMVAEMVCGSN